MGRKSKVEISRVLALIEAGESLSQVARKVGISVEAVRKKLLVLEAAKAVHRISVYPATWALGPAPKLDKLKSNLGGIRKVEMGNSRLQNRDEERSVLDPRRLVETTHHGERFRIVEGELKGGKVVPFGRGKVAVRRQWLFSDVTLIAWPSGKVQAWLKSHRKSALSPRQVVVSGTTDIRVRVREWAEREGIALEYVGPIGRKEWVTTTKNKGVSKGLLEEGGLREQSRVLDDVHLFEDKSPGKRGLVESHSLDERGVSADVFWQKIYRLVGGENDAPHDLEVLKKSVEFATVKIVDRLKALEARQEGGSIQPVSNENRREVG